MDVTELIESFDKLIKAIQEFKPFIDIQSDKEMKLYMQVHDSKMVLDKFKKETDK